VFWSRVVSSRETIEQRSERVRECESESERKRVFESESERVRESARSREL
jgi:hypothetical protein